jgi:hypothetical protein
VNATPLAESDGDLAVNADAGEEAESFPSSGMRMTAGHAFHGIDLLDAPAGVPGNTGAYVMINLILWSFMLALVPLTAGIVGSLTAALSRSSPTPLKIDGVKAN